MTCRPLFLDVRSLILVSWLSSSRTEFVDTLNSLANALKYELVLGLKKKRISSLIRVFDEISPVNKLSKNDSFMSRFTTHNIFTTFVNYLFIKSLIGIEYRFMVTF